MSMHVLTAVLSVVVASSSFAREAPSQKRQPSNQAEVQAQSLDPEISSEQLRAAGFKVSGPIRLNEIPQPKSRDSYFAKAGLQEAVAGMDQFDKDILFMRASRYTAERLTATYKKLPKAGLLRLQSLVMRAQ
jgi:hypothetical protein